MNSRENKSSLVFIRDIVPLKNMENTPTTIRLSRIPLFFLFIVGSLFFVAGLDIVFFHTILDFSGEDQSKSTLYVFAFFTIGIGGLVAIQMLLYIISPPITLLATEKGLSFATGFRYKLYTIPWSYVDKIGTGIDKTILILNKKVVAGLQIEFKKSKEIESWKATSIGVAYFNYVLTLNWFYMNNKNTPEIIEQLVKKSHSG